MNPAKGFTLIEVLVAMAITAIAATLAYSGLDSAIKLAESSQEAADDIQQMNRVFDIMARDFQHAIPRKVRAPDGDGFEHAFSYDEQNFPMLKLSRNGWVNPLPERFKRSHLQRVHYHYDGEKLIRYSWPVMDRYDDSEPDEFVLLDNVTAFTLRVMKLDTTVQNNKVVNVS